MQYKTQNTCMHTCLVFLNFKFIVHLLLLCSLFISIEYGQNIFVHAVNQKEINASGHQAL